MENLHDPPEALLRSSPNERVLALAQTTLRQVFQCKWFAGLLDDTHFVFVYGFTHTDGESPELQYLTGGALTSINNLISAESKQFTIHSNVKFGGYPVSGKSYWAESGPMAVFSSAAPEANSLKLTSP